MQEGSGNGTVEDQAGKKKEKKKGKGALTLEACRSYGCSICTCCSALGRAEQLTGYREGLWR